MRQDPSPTEELQATLWLWKKGAEKARGERLRSKQPRGHFQAATCACAHTLLYRENHPNPYIYQETLDIVSLLAVTVVSRDPLPISKIALSPTRKFNISSGTLQSSSTFQGNIDKMLNKFYVQSIMLLFIIGIVIGAENYRDYGDGIPEKTPVENIHELYRLLMQRSALENARYGEIPFEHLMIRKSQRSPSLRLRFGRSDPHLSIGLLSRPMDVIGSPRFDDN